MDRSVEVLIGMAAAVIAGLVAYVIYRRLQRRRVHRVEGWVKEYLSKRYGELPARIVLLNAADDSEVHIDRVESDHPAVDCRWAQGPGHQATLKIRVDRKQIPGDRLRAYVQVHLSKPAAETITIPISCLLH